MTDDIPDFARAQATSGPIAAANRFLDAVQTGDLEAACDVAIPELEERLRGDLLETLRGKWADVDSSWGWTASPRAFDVNLELVLLVEQGETGWITAEEGMETMAVPFVMQYSDETGWRVYALEVPPSELRPRPD